MINREFSVGPKPAISVQIQSGRVEVTQGQQGIIIVEVDTADPGFEVEQRGDLITAHSDRTQWVTRNSAYVRLEVPEGTDANITTASADVEASVPLGDVLVKTASGEVELRSAKEVTIKTASGDAEVRHVAGDIKVSSASGDVQIGECCGEANFSSASGDIRIESALDSIVASTASGDVSINSFCGPKASLKTMSGSATIGVPEGTRVDLDAELLSGRLSVPEPSPAKKPVERDMSIRAKMVSGDLSIRRA